MAIAAKSTNAKMRSSTDWNDDWKKPCEKVLELMEKLFPGHKNPPEWLAHFEKSGPKRKHKSASA